MVTGEPEVKQDKVIDLIRKILARTTENGCTEAEAAEASAKAQELMQKYQLTLGSVKERDTQSLIVKRDVELGGDEEWRALLILYISEFCFTKAWGWGHRGTVLGEDHNIDILMSVYEFLAGQYPRLCRKAYVRAVADGSFRLHRSYWDEPFYRGLTSAVYHRLWEQNKKFQESSEASMALVVDYKAAVKAKYDELYPPAPALSEEEKEKRRKAWEEFERMHPPKAERPESPETRRQLQQATAAGISSGASIVLNREIGG